MRISEIRVQGQHVEFNGSAEQARQLLTSIAVSITDGNAVKSGYLKLVGEKTKDGQQQFNLGLRWSKSSNDDTARSTALVKALVTKGYGEQPEVMRALDTYLGKTNGKIGSQSLVRLVKTLGQADQAVRPGAQQDSLARQPSLDGVRVKDSARLDAQSFAAEVTQRVNAQEVSQRALNESQPEAVRSLCQRNLLAAPQECRKLIELLEGAIQTSEAAHVPADELRGRLAQIKELLSTYEPTEKQLEAFLRDPKAEFQRRAESALNASPSILNYRQKLDRLKEQIESKTNQIISLAKPVAADSFASPSEIKALFNQSRAMEEELTALRKEYSLCIEGLDKAITKEFEGFELSWHNRGHNNQGFSDLPNIPEMDQKNSELSSALNAAKQAIAADVKTLGSTANEKFDFHFKDWTTIRTALQKRAGEWATTAKGRELIKELEGFAKSQALLLESALTAQEKAEGVFWHPRGEAGWDPARMEGLNGSSQDRTELSQEEKKLVEVLRGPVVEKVEPSEKQKKLLEVLRERMAQAAEIRSQCRGKIAGWLEEKNNDSQINSLLSKGDVKALQDKHAQWDRRLQQMATTNGGIPEPQIYDKPVAPHELTRIAPSWTYARYGLGRAAVSAPQSSEPFVSDGKALSLTPSLHPHDQAAQALSFFKGRTGRVCVLSAGVSPTSSGYAAAQGKKEDMEAYFPSVGERVAAHSEFRGKEWMPNLLAFSADDVGVKLVLEDVAPTSDGGNASLDSATARASHSVRRNVMATHIADVAGGLADLHDRGWRVATRVAEEIGNFAIGTDGKTKFVGRLVRSASPSDQHTNVEGLAKMLIGSFGEPYEDSSVFTDRFFETVGLKYGPQTPQEALKWKLEYVMTESGAKTEDQDGESVFNSNPDARQQVYEKLNLMPYADWIERALFPSADSQRATAAELKELLLKSQPGAGTSESRATLRRKAEGCLHQVFSPDWTDSSI